jgi:hypothetical protein
MVRRICSRIQLRTFYISCGYNPLTSQCTLDSRGTSASFHPLPFVSTVSRAIHHRCDQTQNHRSRYHKIAHHKFRKKVGCARRSPCPGSWASDTVSSRIFRKSIDPVSSTSPLLRVHRLLFHSIPKPSHEDTRCKNVRWSFSIPRYLYFLAGSLCRQYGRSLKSSVVGSVPVLHNRFCIEAFPTLLPFLFSLSLPSPASFALILLFQFGDVPRP